MGLVRSEREVGGGERREGGSRSGNERGELGGGRGEW